MAVPDSSAKQWALLSPTPSPPAPPEASEAHWAGPTHWPVRCRPQGFAHPGPSAQNGLPPLCRLRSGPPSPEAWPLFPGASLSWRPEHTVPAPAWPTGEFLRTLTVTDHKLPGAGKVACLLRAPPSPTGQVFAPRPTPALGSQTIENAETWLSFPDPQAPHL